MTRAVPCYIALGSNLGDPAGQLAAACDALDLLPDTRLGARSPLYRSAPLGPAGQPDYLNAVARVDTLLDPLALLDGLQGIETAQGRVRTAHWGPRTLDLDILLYGDRRIDATRLKVPHPEMHRRAFVLYPLSDIAPGLRVPGLGPLDGLLAGCPANGLERLPDGAGA